jgi:molybdopterin/thiamine biosynthesis adenylyltransferase
VVCIGAGGLISHIAPTLLRKGVGRLSIFDPDMVEASNLNRQRFYRRDIGKAKAIALVRNLVSECIHSTEVIGYSMSLETAIYRGIDLHCDVAVVGVDNDPTRVAASRFFRKLHVPAIFMAVDTQGNHGYVFRQGKTGPCLGCLFPDIAGDDYYPCPATPAISDILQLVGALTIYAVDAVLMHRSCDWNYRSEYLSSAQWNCSTNIRVRSSCRVAPH